MPCQSPSYQVKVGKLSWKWWEWTAFEFREPGSLSNDDGDGNKNGKWKRFRLAKQQLCTYITLFCTFLSRRCTTTTWKCLISRFVEDGNTGQQFSFSFLELWYSPSELNSQKIANIWQTERDGISAIKFEAARIHFLSDVFVALPSLLFELPSDGKINRFAVSAVKST